MFQKIGTKVLALFVTSVMLWVSALGIIFYWIAAKSLESQVDSTLKTTAAVLASQWDGSMLLALHPGMEQAALYRSFAERLKFLKHRTQLEAITIVTVDRTNIVSSESGILIGQRLPRLDLLQAEMGEALQGRIAASHLVRVQQHQYKSALAPIYAGSKVVAILAVDMSPQYLVYLRTFRSSLLIFTAIALCSCVVSARLFSRTITEPISRMVQRVDEIGKAQYEHPLKIGGSDELSELAVSIETMRQNILHRDAQMKMMLSGIAHEIRNPLGGMELFAGILEKEDLSQEQREYVRKIQSEIYNLKQLLNEFLDFAKPRRMEYQNVDLSELMSEVHDMVAPELEEKQARWTVDIQPEVRVIQADRAKLKQALLNLYRNAFQALPPHGDVASFVSNNGAGIVMEITNSQNSRLAPEMEQKIFEPFFTTKEKGMGLGLPLAKRIIESHGGELKLSENADSRITFSIKLPTGMTQDAKAQDAKTLDAP